MVAVLILGVVLTSVLTVASQCFRYLHDIRTTARSSQILQQKMEDIRLLSWTAVGALPSTFTNPNDPTHIYAGTIAQSSYGTYNGTSTIVKVTLSVTWTNKGNVVRTNTLTSLISCGGLNKYIF